MAKTGDTCEPTIPIRCCLGGDSDSGTMGIALPGCTISDDAGTELGNISPTIGGGLQIHIKATGDTWSISPTDVWFALCDALERSDDGSQEITEEGLPARSEPSAPATDGKEKESQEEGAS